MQDDDSKSRTVWCGNLSGETTEKHLYELFLQAGPLETVNIPKDKEGKRRSFGFITFKHEVSVPYAIELLNGLNLNGRPLRLDRRDGAKDSANPYKLAMQRHLENHEDHGNLNNHHEMNQMGRYDQGHPSNRDHNTPLLNRNHNMQSRMMGPNWRQQVWEQNGSRWSHSQDGGFSFQMTSISTSQAALSPQFFMYGQNSPLLPYQQMGIQNRVIQNFQSSGMSPAQYWNLRR